MGKPVLQPVTLKRGTLIHVNGMPFRLTTSVTSEGRVANLVPRPTTTASGGRRSDQRNVVGG